jgi:hypothetical protein
METANECLVPTTPAPWLTRAGLTSNLSSAWLLEHALMLYRHCHTKRAALLGPYHSDTSNQTPLQSVQRSRST